jgi:hypothetical protein
MRLPFQAQIPSRTAETAPFRVRSANDPSEPRTLEERSSAQTKEVSPDTAIAPGIAKLRPIMPAAALVLLLLAASPPAWSAVPDLPPEVEAAHLAAEASSRAGDYRGAAMRLQEILADLERRPATQAPEEEWTRTLLQLALAESTLGNAPAARGAMERVLALDPAAQIDPELFSPAFRREFELARERVSALPRFRLVFSTRSGSGRGFIQGRPSGDVPVEVKLPAGSYRVGVEVAGVVRTVTVQLTRDESLVIDTAAPAPDLSASPPRPPLPAVAKSPGGWIRPVAWVTTGLAVTAAGVATWAGVAAAGSYSEAKGMLLPDGSLKPGVDPAAYAAKANAYDSQRTTAWIAAGSAVALGAGATVLWLVAPSARVEPAPGGVAIRF